MSIRSTIAMATSKFRLVQILGKQLKQTPIRHEIPFSTAPKVLKEAAAVDLPTHTGQVIIRFTCFAVTYHNTR
jgi:hypothetical protein